MTECPSKAWDTYLRGQEQALRETGESWLVLTRRTNDPKLAWLERALTKAGIASRRAETPSYHAPILEVPEALLVSAWGILEPVDHIDDDDPRWT